VHGLIAKLSQDLNLLDADILYKQAKNSNNEILNRTTKKAM
jgi:hypothetical protein